MECCNKHSRNHSGTDRKPSIYRIESPSALKEVNKQKHILSIYLFFYTVLIQCAYLKKRVCWFVREASVVVSHTLYGESICCIRKGISVHRQIILCIKLLLHYVLYINYTQSSLDAGLLNLNQHTTSESHKIHSSTPSMQKIFQIHSS